MKYPQQQFTTLLNTLKALQPAVDLFSLHPSNIHFLVYQQHSQGQKHNCIGSIQVDGQTMYKRFHAVENKQDFQPLVNPDVDFELYPAGCNDAHIETAIKSALKMII
jgi:hypothetical protein